MMRFSAPTLAASPVAAGFQPIAPLLHALSSEMLDAARRRVAGLDRGKLIDAYRCAFASDKRLAAFIMADELTARGIPPCFRLNHGAATSATLEQRFDLFLTDLRWLRRWYPDHVRIVRYQRSKTLLTGSEAPFHREAEYAFYQGRRPAWKLVASLSLDHRQQFDCYWLRSTPIKQRDAATHSMRERVFQALQDDLQSVRRTSTFTDEDAHATLLRRHRLWFIGRMVQDRSPTEVARRYQQMTGEQITRQAVGKQLEKISEVLSRAEMKKRIENG